METAKDAVDALRAERLYWIMLAAQSRVHGDPSEMFERRKAFAIGVSYGIRAVEPTSISITVWAEVERDIQEAVEKKLTGLMFVEPDGNGGFTRRDDHDGGSTANMHAELRNEGYECVKTTIAMVNGQGPRTIEHWIDADGNVSHWAYMPLVYGL